MGKTNSTAGQAEIIKIKKGIWRTYDATDGLPGAPYHLLQDRQGYLWIGTDVGLCRYDGTDFVSYTTAHGLVGNRVNALCEDHEGKLWVGTSGALSCFDGRQFISYTVADGLAGNDVISLCADSQGRLWIGTGNGLSCLDKNGFTNYTTDDGLPHDHIYSICEDKRERLWFGTMNGLSCFDGQRFKNYTTADGLPHNHASPICMDNQGRLWISSWYSSKGVSCFDGKHFKTYTSDDGLVGPQNIFTVIYNDRHGRMWFGGWDGVSCYDDGKFINYSDRDGIRAVFDILQDREGQMWFAHGQLSYLSCFDEKTIQLLTDQSSSWVVDQDRKERIWFNSGNDICVIRPDPISSEVEQRKISFNMGMIGLMVDSGDRLWISPFNDGLYRYDSTDNAWESAGGEVVNDPRHFVISDDAFLNNAVPLFERKDGTIWFSYLSQLYRYAPERFMDEDPIEFIGTSLKQGQDMYYLIEDSHERLWMSDSVDSKAPLFLWDGHDFTTYTQENGFTNNGIASIFEDDDGSIWIGTSRGLWRYDGERFIHYGEEYGLKDLYHWRYIVKDIFDQLWFATRGGVYRTDGRHFQWLTEDDGLPGNNVAGLLPQPDGAMIICTSRGIVRYRMTATLSPRVEIREVIADKVYQNPDEIELTTTTANLLTISYHGLSLATRRMRYSYILEGYDKECHETWERQVRYENLPTGEYTFKVIAINRDLVTSEAPAELKLKVVPDPRDVKNIILQSKLNHIRREVGAEYDFHEIVGKSDAIKEVQMRMERAIKSSLNVVVLITGETGTGKELVANAIHENSSRKSKPRVPYNCSAIPRELGASIFFGHRKGAFTDAHEDRIGLFEAAEGGTLILDEIGDMPLDAQSSLLRVLSERKFQRVGEEHIARDADVCIIAMTNRDLEKESKEGRFRRDLYFRLNEFPIHLPPLRERLEDVPILAEYFLKLYSRDSGKEMDGFASGLLEILKSYPWPGNVRELRNAVHWAAEYAVYEGTGVIQPHHFPFQMLRDRTGMQDIISERLSYQDSLNLFKRRLIEDVLRESGGNKSEAARMLGMKRPNLLELIKRLKIKIDD